MPAPKKRSLFPETKPTTGDDSAKFRKKKKLAPDLSLELITQTLVEIYAKKLKESLFMHQGRFKEIYHVLTETDAENNRVQSVLKLLDILRRPPTVPTFLLDFLFLFLKPDEAIDLNCFESHRSKMQSLDILLKFYQYQKTKGSKSFSKGFLKSLGDRTSAFDDPSGFYDALSQLIGGDFQLREFMAPLIPDQLFDSSNVTIADMETISDDHLANQESSEFEIVDLSDFCSNEISISRQCNCQCHDGSSNGITSHCGLCIVKFSGGHVYVWRGNRLVRAQADLITYKSSEIEDISVIVNDPVIKSTDMDGALESYRMVETDRFLDQPLHEPFSFLHLINVTPKKSAIDDIRINYGTGCKTPPFQLSPSTTPRKQWSMDDSTQDMLKRGFVETFGPNMWAKGASPLKRSGSTFGMMYGLNDESNSTSNLFVRGFDGANTMLTTLATDSNSCAWSALVAGHSATLTRDAMFIQESPMKMVKVVAEEPVGDSTDKDMTGTSDGHVTEKCDVVKVDDWTEDDDRYLLERFKLHGNIYEAATAAMGKLQRSRHTVRDRLKLLLDLLKETMQ